MNFFSQVSKSAAALGLSVALAMVGGCDQSKAELDQTKDQLAKVTSERDQLKGQADTMKQSMDALKTENEANKAKLAESDAKLAACAPQGTPAAATPEHEHHAAKGKTAKPGVAPPAPKQDASAPAGSQQNATKVNKSGVF